MKKIPVGLVGFGYWGPNYARLINSHPQAQLTVICDLNKDILKQAKTKYNVFTSTSIEEIVKKKLADVFIVSTNLGSHHKITKFLLENNKHVLLEKPMAKSSAECDELIKIAKEKKATLMIGHTFIYNNYFQKLNSLVKAGDFGKLRFITSTRTNLGPIRADTNVMWDLAPHDLSMILDLVGEAPSQVFAHGADYLKEGSIDVAFIVLKFPGNILANISLSWLSPIKVRELTVVGSKKMAVFNDVSIDNKLTIFDKGVTIPPRESSFEEFIRFGIYQGEETVVSLPIDEPLSNQFNHFIASVLSKSKPTTGGVRGKEVVRILELCEKSYFENSSKHSL